MEKKNKTKPQNKKKREYYLKKENVFGVISLILIHFNAVSKDFHFLSNKYVQNLFNIFLNTVFVGKSSNSLSRRCLLL